MTVFRKIAASALAFALTGGIAMAQYQDHHDSQQDHHYDHDHNYDHGHYDHDHYDHDHYHYVHHPEWRHGYRMHSDEWRRGERIDWRVHHLRRPPRGYEWREVDGNYVMAAIATGVIASVIAASIR